MTGSFGWDLLIGVGGALLFAWLALLVALAILRPRGGLLREAVRILPDVLRLVRRLAGDSTLPRGIRVRLGLLLAYLAIPIDLIPDFIPVLGYLDDLLLVPLGLLLVIRLLPPAVLVDARRQAALRLARPRSRAAAVVIVGLWLAACAAGLGWWLRA